MRMLRWFLTFSLGSLLFVLLAVFIREIRG